MKYGVIVCPKCKKSKGVILSNKTTRCIRCGKILELDKTRIFYKTDSKDNLINYIGVLNKKVEGK